MRVMLVRIPVSKASEKSETVEEQDDETDDSEF